MHKSLANLIPWVSINIRRTNNFKNQFPHIPLNCRGETSLQLIIPLIILLFFLVGIAYVMPTLSPLKMLGLVLGVAIFFFSFISTEIGLYVLIFSMLLSPEFIVGSTTGATLGRGVTLRLDDILLVFIGLSWLAKMAINKDLGLFLRTPLNKPIGYYIIICLVSTLFGALFGRVSLVTGIFFVLKYFEYMIVFFMAANHMTMKSQARNYVWALIITCTIVSFIGIAQIPGGGRISAPFEGEMGEPNTLGGYLAFMMMIVVGLLITTKSLRSRIIYFVLIVVFAVPLLYTQSRSSYIALVPAMIPLMVLSPKKQWIIGIVLVGLALPFIIPEQARERVMYTFVQGKMRQDVVTVGGVKLDTSTSARLKDWRAASKDWINHPLLGYGITGYKFLDAQYIRVVLETGLVGLGFFLVLIYHIFKQAYAVSKDAADDFEKGVSIGFIAGLVALLFHSIGSNTFIIVRIMEPFWFMTAAVIMLPTLKRTEEPIEKQ